LRRPNPHHNLALRHKIILEIRKVNGRHGLSRSGNTHAHAFSTPEGVADFSCPSGFITAVLCAAALAAIFQQILMSAGLDKYFQIVKCFSGRRFARRAAN